MEHDRKVIQIVGQHCAAKAPVIPTYGKSPCRPTL